MILYELLEVTSENVKLRIDHTDRATKRAFIVDYIGKLKDIKLTDEILRRSVEDITIIKDLLWITLK